MAEKHVAVCDYCGKQVPLRDPLDGRYFPPGWLVIVPSVDGLTGIVNKHDLCSWACVEGFAWSRTGTTGTSVRDQVDLVTATS